MQSDPCTVCGGEDLNLIDGFYYCVECGTQNTNVRETVVEQKALGDGTFALATRRKIVQLDGSKIQMSKEWYKWHAYNYIILGLADELVAAGAKASFKMKLLWIWMRYIKKYQNKDEFGALNTCQDAATENLTLHTFMVEENSNSLLEADKDENETHTEESSKKNNKNSIVDGSKRDIRSISRSLIVAMLYLALNLDRSEIQLSHLYRFIKEKRINLTNLPRFVPKEIPVKDIPQWVNFLHSKLGNKHQIRALSMSLLRKLDLGAPKVPDLSKMVDNFMLELCLPKDMKPLVHSLMHFHRCDFLDVNNKTKETLVRIPDYEVVVMCYIVVALKMCFGLDCDYEERLCNVVEQINLDRNLPKSHRFGKYSAPSNRLFSFREWSSFMQFRKIMVCKSCLHMADHHYLDIDDNVYLEQMEIISENKKELQDETAMDLIMKIPDDDVPRVISKDLFLPTVTPMADYTEVLVEYMQEEEMRLRLSEDFTQYSTKYVSQFLDLIDENGENIVTGVSEDRKVVNKLILGTITTKKSKAEMVYVKNCENRNWMKTNPPTTEHVTCEESLTESNDKEGTDSDLGYDSENTAQDKETDKATNEKEKILNDTEALDKDLDISINEKEKTWNDLEDNFRSTNEIILKETDENIKDQKKVIVTEEDADKNIFDDDFVELDIKDEIEQNNNMENFAEPEDAELPVNSFRHDIDNISNTDSDDTSFAIFNPETFDREQTIKELIILTCRKYKIPIPAEYKTKEAKKWKLDMFGNEAGPSEPKKRIRAKPGETKQKVKEIIDDYYRFRNADLLSKVQNELNLAIRNSQFDGVLNATSDVANQPIDQNMEPIDDAMSDVGRNSVFSENMDPNLNLQNNTSEDTLNKTDNDKTVEEIDEDLESKLFDEDEIIKTDDLIPKCDPKFDEQKYDINQLYLKIKFEDEEDIYDLQEDPKLEHLLDKKIEQCKESTEFEKLKPVKIEVKTKYESDSDDEVPLSILQQEKKQIEEMLAKEDNFDPLISKENIPEYKYWFRHYDTDFMLRSIDWHEKFDEELKANTPASFYFVIKECAAILNCTTFYLYKHMQYLEQYIISRANKIS